jgi:hypothetical protein
MIVGMGDVRGPVSGTRIVKQEVRGLREGSPPLFFVVARLAVAFWHKADMQ